MLKAELTKRIQEKVPELRRESIASAIDPIYEYIFAHLALHKRFIIPNAVRIRFWKWEKTTYMGIVKISEPLRLRLRSSGLYEVAPRDRHRVWSSKVPFRSGKAKSPE
jgi:hypothetical protein